MRIYAWHSSKHAGLIPASRRVDLVSLAQSPADVAQRIAADLRDMLPGERTLMIPGNIAMLVEMEVDPARNYSAIGPNASSLQGWVADLFWELRHEPIDALWLDMERMPILWTKGDGSERKGSDRVAYFQAIYAEPRIAGLPPVDPASLENHGNREAYIALMQREDEIKADLMRRVFADPFLGLWPNARVSNYGDARPTFEVYDRNGWPLRNAGVSGISSPALYLTRQTGQRYKGQPNPAWRAFTDLLNIARSCRNLIPWISPPGYGIRDGKIVWDADPRLWTELIKHLLAMGVAEALYWNPGNVARDVNGGDAYAMHVIWYWSKRIKPTSEQLGEIPADATEVTTGGVTTRLEDMPNG